MLSDEVGQSLDLLQNALCAHKWGRWCLQLMKYSVQQHNTKEQLPGTTHTKLAPVINKEEQQKPVFISKPKNFEIRIKTNTGIHFKARTTGNQLEYIILTFVKIAEST